jgi:hypothetical protein
MPSLDPSEPIDMAWCGLHEALHVQGFRDERETDRFAIRSMAAAGPLVKWDRTTSGDWSTTQSAGDRAMRLAWQQEQRHGDGLRWV